MLSFTWLILLITGIFLVGYKIFEAVASGCLTILRRTGPFIACTYNDPLAYFGLLGFWVAIFIVLVFFAFPGLRRILSRKNPGKP